MRELCNIYVSASHLLFLFVLSDLDHNGLHGSIPAEFSQLKSLKKLVLSCNELSGKVPDMDYADINECELYSRTCWPTSNGNKFSNCTDSAKKNCQCVVAAGRI